MVKEASDAKPTIREGKKRRTNTRRRWSIAHAHNLRLSPVLNLIGQIKRRYKAKFMKDRSLELQLTLFKFDKTRYTSGQLQILKLCKTGFISIANLSLPIRG